MPKKRLKKNERRQQILENAARVFARHGYQGARTREIAEACGINEALLYRHFPSKLDLFKEVISGFHDRIIDLANSLEPVHTDGYSILNQIVEVMIANVAGNRMFGANTVQSISAAIDHEEIRELLANRVGGHRDTLVALIKSGIEDGSIRKDIDPSIYASILLGMGWIYVIGSASGIRSRILPDDIKDLFRFILGIARNEKGTGNHPDSH